MDIKIETIYPQVDVDKLLMTKWPLPLVWHWGSPSDIDPLPPPYPPHIWQFVRSKRGDNPQNKVFVKKISKKFLWKLGYLFIYEKNSVPVKKNWYNKWIK
jgi:hypothetical protein